MYSSLKKIIFAERKIDPQIYNTSLKLKISIQKRYSPLKINSMEITFLMSLNGEFGVQKELYEMKPLHNYKMKEALINKCIKVLVNKFCD